MVSHSTSVKGCKLINLVETIKSEAENHIFAMTDVNHTFSCWHSERRVFQSVVNFTGELITRMDEYLNGIPIVRLFSKNTLAVYPHDQVQYVFMSISLHDDGDAYDSFNKFVEKHW